MTMMPPPISTKGTTADDSDNNGRQCRSDDCCRGCCCTDSSSIAPSISLPADTSADGHISVRSPTAAIHNNTPPLPRSRLCSKQDQRGAPRYYEGSNYQCHGRRRSSVALIMTRQIIMTMVIMLLMGFIGCTTASGAPPHDDDDDDATTKSTSLRNLQSPTPCEDKGATNKGQCENNGQGNSNLCCLWNDGSSGTTCTTLSFSLCPSDSVIDIGSSTSTSSPAPSYIPPLEPIAPPPSKGPTVKPSPDVVFTRRPTVQPAAAVPTGEPSVATVGPTHFPTREPSKRPTVSPTRSPSREPSVSPSGGPSFVPTETPTHEPTKRPTRSPTASPSAVPSIELSGSPSGSPSASPTHGPTISPTQNPTFSSHPSYVNWPSAPPSLSTMPTSSPTVYPSTTPSASPTFVPTVSPTTLSPTTAKPTTARPTTVVVVPTNKPTVSVPRTMLPTSEPTYKPTVDVREYIVVSSMVLFGVYDELDSGAEDAWQKKTRDKIYEDTLSIIGGAGSDLSVVVTLDDQTFVESTLRMLASADHGVDNALDMEDAHMKSAGYHHHLLRRSLQSATTQVRLDFTTTIKFNSPEEEWDANQMVADGFASPVDQQQYIYSLKAADAAAFEGVDRMAMSVEGELITETGDSGENKVPTTKKNTSTYYIIVGSVGGALLLFVAGGLIYKKQKKDNESQQRQRLQHNSSVKYLPQDKPSMGTAPGLPPREAFEQRPLPPTLPPAQNYFGTIESREGEDDVSTLGDPYFGEGVPPPEPRADDTVAESMISSEQEMYVFGVGRARLNTGNTVGGSSRMESTMTGGTGNHHPSGRMVFGDDTTLEDAYQTPNGKSNTFDDGDNDDGTGGVNFERLVVVAPAGRIGIVVDNQTGDLPIIHGVKETSALRGRVVVGDLLLSVDEIDCRGMSAVQVSRLISHRSNNPARTFVLLRGSVGC